jgi:hypothetical protein
MSHQIEPTVPSNEGGPAAPPPAAVQLGPRVERALQRLRSVFSQVPDLRLSLGEAARIAELEAYLCHVLLKALEDLRFVKRGADGLYQGRKVEEAD